VLVGLLADIEGELDTLAARLHRQLYKSLAEEQFVTLFIGELEPATGRLVYVNAGHEPALIAHRDGGLSALESTTLPFAMMEEIPLVKREVVIEPGDLVAVFSDGIPEATTNGEKFLGLDGMKKVLVDDRAEPLPLIRGRIVQAVESFLAGGPASDDVTLILLRRTAV
jgi:serine phosphatase RsbU (regulator of sigma subunit)